MTVLVTGGAGYIGAHAVRALLRAGRRVAILDDLSTGHRDTVPDEVPLCVADIADAGAVGAFIAAQGVSAVLHFAARSLVGESVADPRKYWRDNVAGSVALLGAVVDAGVRDVVVSSTAAVYGVPERSPLDEAHRTNPVNPYGATKLAVERALADYAAAYPLRYAALRYFNAAGADPDAGLGERHDPETHLIPRVLRSASEGCEVAIHGTDWDTRDGTCVRDYVHVRDLADAHVAALRHLEAGGAGGAFNLGTGTGSSVREVIDVVAKVTGRPLRVVEGPRRAGDPPVLVADATRASRELGFSAARSSLRQVVEDAWAFERGRSGAGGL